MGCFNYVGTLDRFKIANDPATDPGNWQGHYQSGGSAQGDLILDFSEPVSGFGVTSFTDAVINANNGDTLIVYDGPAATGNVLGTAFAGPAVPSHQKLIFAGVITPTAQIRSARVLRDGQGFFIDAYAVSLPPAPGCGSADFNGDGDLGTDGDIEAFFRCLGGNCCATCGSADFNADGDIGTDADIESFFRVLAGGPC
jgi:hypothetical protein